MNLLQSIVGCMYPGSIRTESIESMDHDQPDCRFQVSNIDERENEVSRGELQLTDRDLIYFSSSRFPTRWPLDSIRRYGCSDQGNKFIFEAGRRCPTGQAIFAFRINHGTELVERLREKIERFPNCEVDKADVHQNEILMNNRLNRLSASNQQTFCTPDDNKFHDPQAPHLSPNELNDKTKRDAATSTDNQILNQSSLHTSRNPETSDPRPLSYASIDFDTTKALNESAQAHAASRVR